MTSQNFNSFSDEKKYFLRTLRIPSYCNILVTFLSKKTSVEANVMLLQFVHSIVFEIVHNLSFCNNSVYLIDLYTMNLTPDIRYTLCPFIHKSDSVAIESSPRGNSWVEGSNPGGNYASFSVSRRMNLFPLKTVHFVPLIF